MRRVLMVLAMAVSMVLFVGGVAMADTVTTDFEAPLFHVCAPSMPVFAACGTVDGQDGWKSAVPGDIPSLPNGYDQQVVANSGAPPAFGGQSLRLSNAYNQSPLAGPPEFFYQTYSKPTLDAAGVGLANTEYIAQFSFISTHPDAQQPGLFVSVSPDDGFGGRMSYIGLEDTPAGIDVSFYDSPSADGEFVEHDLGTLPRDVPHTIKFWIKFNPAPASDLLRISIDGKDVGQCFTTWANYYRSVPQAVPEINTLQFRSTGDQVSDSLVGGGYLFDNVSITTANGPGPPGCDLPIEKTADAPTAIAGGLAGYRITVRNRGRLSARNVQVCDRIPRRMTFVRADRKLFSLGRRRCLFIPRLVPGQRVSFHLVLRVNANAPPGRETNIVDETPGVPPPDMPTPPTPPAIETPTPTPPLPPEAIPPAHEADAPIQVEPKPAPPKPKPKPAPAKPKPKPAPAKPKPKPAPAKPKPKPPRVTG